MQPAYKQPNSPSLSHTPHGIIKRHTERRFLLITGGIAVVLLGCLLRPGMNLGNIFPRVSLVGTIFAVIISLRIPRLALPSFIVLLTPLYALGKTVGQVSLAGYPLSVLSLAIWGLGIYYALLWIIWRLAPIRAKLHRRSQYWRPQRAAPVRSDLQGKVRYWLLLIMVASIPALWMAPGKGNDPFITVLIFFAGTVEPLVLFLCISAWLKCEKDPGLLVISILLSCGVALLVGQVNLEGIRYDLASMDSSALRFNLTGFGGANLTGFVLVSVYPLAFLLLKHSRMPMVIWGCAVVLLWGVAIFSLSRATPVVMGIQTAALLVILRKERARMLGLMGLIGMLGVFLVFSFSKTYFEMWRERMRDTNLQALFQRDFQHVTSSDAQRIDLQQRLVAEIAHHPFGGYAATDQEDPEGLYLDTALQLGWIPALGLLCLHLSMVVAAAKRWKQREGAIGLCIFSGVILYGLTTGVNLAKAGGDATQQYGYNVNAVPTLCVVITLAVVSFMLASRSEPTPIPIR